jgi:hypothetical protein
VDQGFDPDGLPQGPQVRVTGQGLVTVNIQRVADGTAVHIIRYDYDETQDRVPTLPELTLELRLPGMGTGAFAHCPGGELEASLTISGDLHRLELRRVPLYGVVLLKNEDRTTR